MKMSWSAHKIYRLQPSQSGSQNIIFEKCLQNSNLSLVPLVRVWHWEVIISGDSNVPGLGGANNNIIPLITNLQASLKQPSSQEQPQTVEDNRTEEPQNNSLVKTAQPTCDNSRQQQEVTSLSPLLVLSLLSFIHCRRPEDLQRWRSPGTNRR